MDPCAAIASSNATIPLPSWYSGLPKLMPIEMRIILSGLVECAARIQPAARR
jgi:hypothetical protein